MLRHRQHQPDRRRGRGRRLDEIHDPDRSGRGSVLFGRADDRIEVDVGEALGVWQKARGLLTSDLETRGTFGDFDGDGYLDLALFRSQEDIGDSPRSNLLVHEVRYGPLARDLSGSRSGTIRVHVSFFVAAVRATDEDQDGRAELHVFQSAGDGGYVEYIGRQKDGGVTLSKADTGYSTMVTGMSSSRGGATSVPACTPAPKTRRRFGESLRMSRPHQERGEDDGYGEEPLLEAKPLVAADESGCTPGSAPLRE
ncbi:hypothetical protein AB0P17_14695 [Streptomyces sp. NPDC088124]|uniref:hypothetical protein n=1 Tax=Streptomyces sp. NPDC088124 TaxID=3154654 RepID=UPI00344122BD